MDAQVGLKTIALTLFLNLFFYFLLQLLCVMISHWLTLGLCKTDSILSEGFFGTLRRCCLFIRSMVETSFELLSSAKHVSSLTVNQQN